MLKYKQYIDNNFHLMSIDSILKDKNNFTQYDIYNKHLHIFLMIYHRVKYDDVKNIKQLILKFQNVLKLIDDYKIFKDFQSLFITCADNDSSKHIELYSRELKYYLENKNYFYDKNYINPFYNKNVNLFKLLNHYDFYHQNISLKNISNGLPSLIRDDFSPLEIIYTKKIDTDSLINQYLKYAKIIKVNYKEHDLVIKTLEIDDYRDAFIGLYAINKLKKYTDTFMFTYGLHKCNLIPVKNSLLELCPDTVNKYDTYYLLTEYFPNALTFLQFILIDDNNDDNINYNDIILIYLQIFSALKLANDLIGFVHYDLHHKNILIQEYNPSLYIPIYIDNHIIYIKSKYIVRIIDYTFSRIELESTPSNSYLGLDYGKYVYFSHNIIYDNKNYISKCNISDIYKVLIYSIVVLNEKNKTSASYIKYLNLSKDLWETYVNYNKLKNISIDLTDYIPILSENYYSFPDFSDDLFQEKSNFKMDPIINKLLDYLDKDSIISKKPFNVTKNDLFK